MTLPLKTSIASWPIPNPPFPLREASVTVNCWPVSMQEGTLRLHWLVELLHHTENHHTEKPVSRVCRVFEYAEGGSPTHWAFAAVSPADHLLLTLGLTHPPSKSHHMMKMRCHQPTIFSDCAFTQTIAKQSAQKMQAGKLNFIFSTDFRPPPLLCFN